MTEKRTKPVDFSQSHRRLLAFLRVEELEPRITPTGNIAITNALLVNSNDQAQTPVAGGTTYIQVDFTTHDLPTSASYRVSFSIDGNTLDSGYVTWGAGVSGTGSWYLYWGDWFVTAGTHNVTVTVDPDHSVAETSYADNTMSFSFTAGTGTHPPPYTVDQIRTAYGINNIPDFGSAAADGTGQTIAIVDAYNDPNIISDLDGFDKAMTLTTGSSETIYQQYGPASSILSVYNQTGTNITSQIADSGVGAVPQADPTGDAEGEETMDVEWAHAIAPGAKIDLIECSGTGSFDGLFTGATTAGNLPGVTVVSMSWIWSENDWAGSNGSQELAYDSSTFVTPPGHPGVTYLAASGDGGNPAGYPALSPNVVAVGGTTLDLTGDTITSESGWSFATPRTLNNGSSSYSQTSGWSSITGGFSGNYSTAAGGTNSKATWTTSVSSSDEGWLDGIEVSATWVANPANATNATYKIYDGSATTGTLLGTVAVNQTLQPTGTSDGGFQFQDLGDFYPESGKLTVVLTTGSSGSGTVVADAIGIAPDWSSSGGQSQYESEPAYQLPFQSTGYRTAPDVAFDGDINTGVVCYDSYSYPNNPLGGPYGGTSLACPCWAGLIAIVNQGRAAAGAPTLNSSANREQALQAIYSLPAPDFHDITSGYNGFSAAAGYDEVTGRGTPIAPMLVPDLVSYGLTPTVSAINANDGGVAGGSTVTVSGTNFLGTTNVYFGSVAATSFTIVDSTLITAVCPAETSGTVAVSVTTVDGTSVANVNTQFTYVAPTVTTSTAGLMFTATTLTIAGTGFDGTTPGNNQVQFNDGAVGSVTSATDTSLTVTFSAEPTAAGNLTVIVSSDSFTSGSAVQVATVVIPPPTTASLTDNGPDPSLSGTSVGFTISVSGGTPISGEMVNIEDASNGYTSVATPTLTNGTATFTLSSLSVGAHDLIAVYSADDSHQGSQSNQVTLTVQSTFGVNSVTATPSGVVLTFNAPIDPSTTVLYNSPGDTTLGPADVTVVRATTGTLRGSLVIDPTNPYVATFVQTSGLLAGDTYTVTVTNAVKAIGGAKLSGNYSTTVTVAATTTPVLSAPGFARGPGQTVELSNTSGIPISISGATDVTEARFTLTYDPTLLTIASTGALTLSSAASSAGLSITSYSIHNEDASHYVLTVNLSGGTGLTTTPSQGNPTGAETLLTITASVPATAPYLDKSVLNLSGVMVNSAPGAGVSGVDVVAYLGDVLGTGLADATDASLVDQVGSGAGTGFSMFKDLDPSIIASTDGGLFVNANDASLINEAASGASVAQIPSAPTLPAGTSLTFGGPDPYLYLSAVQGSPGQTATETLYLDVTDPNGIQLTALDEAIDFDPSEVQISDVRGAAGLAGIGSYATASTVDNATGVLLVGQAFMGSGLPPVVPYGTDVPVLQFNVILNSNAAVGAVTSLTLLQDGSVNGQLKYTAISDNIGALTWTLGMAPSNSGNPAIDGSVTVVPPMVTVVSEAVLPAAPQPVVILPTLVEPVRRITVRAATQPLATTDAFSTIAASAASMAHSETPTSVAETVLANVGLQLQAPTVVAQPEPMAPGNPLSVTAGLAPEAPPSAFVTSIPARTEDSSALLSLAALGTNKTVVIAPMGTSSVRTSTNVLDEMYRQLNLLSTLPVNGLNLGLGGDDGTEEYPDVWGWGRFLVDADPRKNSDD